MTRRIFVPGVGQYDNIGDIVLRRPLLDALREHGPLHVYLGRFPRGYGEALDLQPADVAYRSFAKWYLALLVASAGRSSHYVFKPGEIQLTLRGMKEHLGMLPAVLAVRLGGGRVARVGVGARNFSRGARALMRPSIAASNISVWRDPETADFLGGRRMPDLAFSDPGTPTTAPRDVLVVSMRGDRPEPTTEWIEAVVDLAAARRLEVIIATQVARDDVRTREIARALGATSLGWDGAGHREQEQKLRALYRRSAVVVSDRLHVLIVAAVEGASPLALLAAPAGKIDRHFAGAGIGGVSVVTAPRDPERVRRQSAAVLERPGLRDQLAAARTTVLGILDELGALLTAGAR